MNAVTVSASSSFLTTSNSMTTTAMEPLPEEVKTALRLRDVYLWVLLAVGLPGNVACLATVLSMSVTTATFYVALLAVADTLALLLKAVFHQLETYELLSDNVVGCNSSWLTNLCSCYANWLLVLICFQRFFAVCFPLKQQVTFTRGRVKVSAGVLAVCLVVFMLPAFFFQRWDARTEDCQPQEALQDFRVAVWEKGLYETVYFFLPFLLVAVFTSLIIVGLQRHRRARRLIQTSTATTVTAEASQKDGAAERAISLMLLCTGLVFLVLTLPACIFQLGATSLFANTRQGMARSYLCYQVVTFLSDTNHAVNFFVYFLSAARFRVRFVQLIRRCFRLGPQRDRGRRSGSSVDDTQLSRATQSKETMALTVSSANDAHT